MFIEISTAELVENISNDKDRICEFTPKEHIIRNLKRISERTSENLVMPIGTKVYHLYDKEAFQNIVTFLSSKPIDERYLVASSRDLMKYLKVSIRDFSTSIQVWGISFDVSLNSYFLAPSFSYKPEGPPIDIPIPPTQHNTDFKTTLF